MNDLSWLIYLADVLPKVGDALGAIFFVIATFGSVLMVTWFLCWKEEGGPKPRWVTFFLVMVSPAVLSAIVPSKETIYLIAGSEAGEVVVTSQQGQEVLDDIQLIIKQQLSNMKENQ